MISLVYLQLHNYTTPHSEVAQTEEKCFKISVELDIYPQL